MFLNPSLRLFLYSIRMKSIHPLSFILGLVSGLIVLLIISAGLHLLSSSNSGTSGNGPSLARMAQRFGITQAELQKELSGGKTIQQIAQEHGIQFGNRRGSASSAGTGAKLQGSGAALPPTSSGAKTSPNASSTIP